MKNPEGVERTGRTGTNSTTGGEANLTPDSMQRNAGPDTFSVLAFVATTDRSRPSPPNPAERLVADDTSPKLATLDGHVQARLGQRLRALFDEVAQEPVPERFLDLLEVLDQQEKRR